MANRVAIGLYTDESPGLKVDPVVVMTLSVVFIFSVVALHGKPSIAISIDSVTDEALQSLPRSCANSPHKLPHTSLSQTLDDGWRSAVATPRIFDLPPTSALPTPGSWC